MARNYKIKAEVSIAHLEKTPEAASGYLDRIGLLIGLLIENTETERAAGILKNCETKFIKAGRTDQYNFWKIQVLIAQEKTDEAQDTLSKIDDQPLKQRLTIFVLENICRKSNDWEPLFKFFYDSYRKNGDGSFLLEACRIKAKQKDWKLVIDHSEELLKKVATPNALYLTSESAWEGGAPSKCLMLLEKNAGLFSDGILPDYLRRLRIQCQQKLGYQA